MVRKHGTQLAGGAVEAKGSAEERGGVQAYALLRYEPVIHPRSFAQAARARRIRTWYEGTNTAYTFSSPATSDMAPPGASISSTRRPTSAR